MRFVLLLGAILLALLAPARAQSLIVESRFPLVSVLFAEQGVQVNLSNVGDPNEAPAPCSVLVEFVLFDPTTMFGTVFKTASFTLANGQTQVADVGLTQPVLIKGKVPTFARVLVHQTTRRTPACRASLEVVEVAGFDRILSRTRVTIGDPHVRPQADSRFPALTLVTGQALRINAVNIGDPQIAPCPVDLDVRDGDGMPVAHHQAAVDSGAAAALDVFVSDPNERVQLRATAQRAKDRIVKESCETFLFSVEIYDLATGVTTLIVGDPEE